MPGYWEMLARAPENRAGENFAQAFIAAQNAAAAARAQKLQEVQYQRKAQAEEQAKEEQARINEAQAVAYAARVAEASPGQYAAARAGLIQRAPSLANALPEQLPVNPAHRAQLLSDWKAVGQQVETPVMSKELADYIQSTPGYVPQDTRAWTPEQRQGYGSFLGNMQRAKGGAAKDIAGDLREEFQKQQTFKDSMGVAQGYEKVVAATPTGPGDMALLYGYVKLLDPGSMVKEQEFAAAAASGSFGERIQGLANQIMTGQRLPDSLRQQFKSEANIIYNAQIKRYNAIANEYRRLASRYGVDPKDVVLDPGFGRISGSAKPVNDQGRLPKPVPGTEDMSDAELESIAGGG